MRHWRAKSCDWCASGTAQVQFISEPVLVLSRMSGRRSPPNCAQSADRLDGLHLAISSQEEYKSVIRDIEFGKCEGREKAESILSFAERGNRFCKRV
ncbi:hypothetical protein IG631_11282 [Alternaria alternata]|nr:hypothetical protein IG631_11282 [Alternaria alternata]